MSTQETDDTIASSWDERGDRSPLNVVAVGSQLGPFVVGRLLGHGGMGMVYEATNTSTGAEVALKTLRRLDNHAASKLKDEFRYMSRIRHPNLAHVFELHLVGSEGFITMERIDGSALGSHLKAVRCDPSSVSKIGELFLQIAEGLDALHLEGLLHLDLKPDNVMVEADGRPRILDFGLTRPSGSRARRSLVGRVAGTPRYMAPERRRGEMEGPAADWYSFGVMLTEALLPSWKGPPEMPDFPKEMSRDLMQICHQLLGQDPQTRPSASRVTSALGGGHSGHFPVSRGTSLNQVEGKEIVGREHELEFVTQGLTSALSSTPTWIHLFGESGVGKTAIVESLRRHTMKSSEVVVLHGVCHERESMPFQGWDEILDDLAEEFAPDGLSASQRYEDLVQAVRSLSSALARDGKSPGHAGESHPLDLRRKAFLAVRQLLDELVTRGAVLIILDDVHWGDADGARLLAEVLARPTPSRLLVVTVSRDETHTDGMRNGFLQQTEEMLAKRGSDAVWRRLKVDRLSDRHIHELLCDLPSDRREAIVRATKGLPVLAEALGGHSWSEDERPSLRALLKARLKNAPRGAEEVLQALALSPSPLPQPVVLDLVPEPSERGQVLATLRSWDLVRTRGANPDGPLEPYHAIIARSIRDDLPGHVKSAVRAKLARTLESGSWTTSEHLANLFQLAGETDEVARLAPSAAREAEQALAFENAAYWWGQAANLHSERRANYLLRKAQCLEFSGRMAAAAEAYSECATFDPSKVSDHVLEAGAAWLAAGYVDEGLSALGPELARLGTPIPPSEGRALIKVLSLLWKLRRRGIRFVPLEGPKREQALRRVDSIWTAAKALGVVMLMRGFVLQLECLMAALEAGEPARVARSLAVVGPALMGSSLASMGASWMQQASVIASQLDDSYLKGLVLTFDAVRMSASWTDPSEVLERAQEGLKMLKAGGGAIAWEETMAIAAGMRARELLGRFVELESLGQEWLSNATDRGDLFAGAMAAHVGAMVDMARGRSSDARHHARSSVGCWSQASFTVQHYHAVRYEVLCDLLEDDPVQADLRLKRAWPLLKHAQVLRNPISRPEALFLRGLVDVFLATRGQKGRCRAVKRTARSLTSDPTPVAAAHAALLNAACLWMQGDTERAYRLAHQAQTQYLNSGLLVQAFSVDLVVARAQGELREQARAMDTLISYGIADPETYARTQTPLFQR